MSPVRRGLIAIVLAVGALLVPSVAHAAPPTNMDFTGTGFGPYGTAVQGAFTSAYGQAATQGYASGQCPTLSGPFVLSQWGSNYQIVVTVRCGGEPTPPATTNGKLPLYRHLAGHPTWDHMSTLWQPLSGYHLEWSLGKVFTTQRAGTHAIYRCIIGNDTFTSTDANCEGYRRISRLGYVYTRQPIDIGFRTLRRCMINYEHFDSNELDCEGYTTEMILGYTVA